MTDPALDIILPCFNPPAGWVDKVVNAVGTIRAALPEVEVQVILVNDGSSTGLDAGQLDKLRERLPGFSYLNSHPNMGKGYALRKGVAAAGGGVQIYTDVDFPYEEDSLLKVYRQLAGDHCDVVAGVRDAGYYHHVPPMRRRISRLLRWMLRTFLRLQITDTQCGLKGFNAAGRTLFLSTTINRFLFDLEFIFLASNDKGVRLCPAEVVLKPDVVFSRVNPRILIREGFNFLRIFFRGLRRRLSS